MAPSKPIIPLYVIQGKSKHPATLEDPKVRSLLLNRKSSNVGIPLKDLVSPECKVRIRWDITGSCALVSACTVHIRDINNEGRQGGRSARLRSKNKNIAHKPQKMRKKESTTKKKPTSSQKPLPNAIVDLLSDANNNDLEVRSHEHELAIKLPPRADKDDDNGIAPSIVENHDESGSRVGEIACLDPKHKNIAASILDGANKNNDAYFQFSISGFTAAASVASLACLTFAFFRGNQRT